jgi:hypothetical protein
MSVMNVLKETVGRNLKRFRKGVEDFTVTISLLSVAVLVSLVWSWTQVQKKH